MKPQPTPPPGPGPSDLWLGAPRGSECPRTITVFATKLRGISPLRGHRLLDVGCGGGTITRAISAGFDEVFGIDVQEPWLERFRQDVTGDPRFRIYAMSASAMDFPEAHFDTLVSIETIEHIPDLLGAVREFHRVLRPGGECLITCPNRLFPFENHGVRIGNREFMGRIPLLPYVPPLHDRWSVARVFSVRGLDRLFLPAGFRRTALDYAWPTFEHGGNPFQPLLRPLFGLMRRLEGSSLRMFGTSIVVRYEKAA
jgi:SAM-dependent methyltransferase